MTIWISKKSWAHQTRAVTIRTKDLKSKAISLNLYQKTFIEEVMMCKMKKFLKSKLRLNKSIVEIRKLQMKKLIKNAWGIIKKTWRHRNRKYSFKSAKESFLKTSKVSRIKPPRINQDLEKSLSIVTTSWLWLQVGGEVGLESHKLKNGNKKLEASQSSVLKKPWRNILIIFSVVTKCSKKR